MVMSKVSTLVSKEIGNYLTNRASWNIFYNAKAEGLAGDGTTDDYADLSTLINTTINGAEATIIFSPGTYKISTSITIPSNISLYFVKGAMLSPDSGVTVTINGPVEAGLWKIFTGSGTIAGSMKVEAVYTEWWGAKGDGVTDDTSAIQAAINVFSTTGGIVLFPTGTYNFTGQLTVTSNIIMMGAGYKTQLKPANTTGNSINVTGSNVVIRDMRIESTTPGGIKISGGSDNVLIENCYFKTLGQVVWLFACTNVTVQNCTFDNTGYGVIQQIGFVSSHVRVLHNTAKNMGADFVEANCAVSAPSSDWIISHNQYLGSASYPTITTEVRFVGITAVENVIISHNFVQKTSGDSAIHLEDIKGDTVIEGNILDNCVGSNPYIYILNSAESMIVSNNIFKRTDTTIGTGTAIDFTSGVYTNDTLIIGNRFVGTNQNLIAIGLGQHDHITITGNRFESCNIGLAGNSTVEHVVLSGNSFRGCSYGIQVQPGTSGGNCNYWIVTGNQFEGTTNRTIDIHRNTSGTGASNGWIVTGNYFDKDARAFDTQDFTAFANQCDPSVVINLGDTEFIGSTRYNFGLNVVTGTGITARSPSDPDTTGATLAQLETEVNTLKAALRTFGVIAN